ncbi:MAG TPA: hypothetical protein VIK74_04475, partial [Parasegetibacter sp.]
AGLVVIGLTRLDNTQDMKTVEEFVENAGFAYMIGVAEESFNNLNYGVGGIPHMVLIDRKGMIRKFEVGANDGKAMEEAIKELLNEKP